MRRKLLPLALVLALLSGCGERAGLESLPAGEETSTPVETGSPFGALPVTEEGIWNYYLHEMNGYYMIRDIAVYEGDYLVELGEGNEGSTMLEWIFGDTGRKVQMTTMGNQREVEIQGRGVLHIRTGGEDTDGEWTVIPRSYTAIAPAEGGYAVEVEETVWMDPGRALRIEGYSERYEQLRDARVDTEGLSFSFIPDTNSMEAFQSFFPACTGAPGFAASLEEETGIFTLRLYNTRLKSGEYTREMARWASSWDYDGLYPRTIPEGPLGEDNLFLANVEICQDGDDAVITARLTDRAGWFTVDSGNLGYDNIPYLRLRFRERDSMEVECGI